MRRTLLKFAVLPALLLVAGMTPARAAEPSAEIANVGVVLYTLTQSPGTLLARWNFGGAYSGPGLAVGGPRSGFAGNYHVRYFLDSGQFSDEYDLEIEKTGDFYDVRWLVGGKLKARGVGVEVGDGHSLAVGWHRV